MNIVCTECGATNRVPADRLDDQPVCGRCGRDLLARAPVNLTDANFQKVVDGTELPTLVDFWAAWCGPCKMMAPQFEAAAAQARGIRFAKVDTDREQQVSARLGIRSIPTLMLFHQGREVARHSGVMPAAELLRWVGTKLPASA